jgi:hypothetical protein
MVARVHMARPASLVGGHGRNIVFVADLYSDPLQLAFQHIHIHCQEDASGIANLLVCYIDVIWTFAQLLSKPSCSRGEPCDLIINVHTRCPCRALPIIQLMHRESHGVSMTTALGSEPGMHVWKRHARCDG